MDSRYLKELDNLIDVQISLPGKDGVPLLAAVKKRKLDCKCEPIGAHNSSPILDTRIYELEFPDERIEEYSFNDSLENITDQVTINDWDASLFDEILSVQKNEGVAV